ncbi:MAG: hypothetical protein A4E28_00200 [Methanocella sp. PtaU1.Bin125]|nr:MAG: hypothetical protein A4E28_00200 [Methanocella sp. PtaU1.Bin125]
MDMIVKSASPGKIKAFVRGLKQATLLVTAELTKKE